MTNKLEDLIKLRAALGNTKVGHWADPWELVYLLDDLDTAIRTKEQTVVAMKKFENWVGKLKTENNYSEVWDF